MRVEVRAQAFVAEHVPAARGVGLLDGVGEADGAARRRGVCHGDGGDRKRRHGGSG